MVTALLQAFRPQLDLYSSQAREAAERRRAHSKSTARQNRVVTADILNEFIGLGIALYEGLREQAIEVQEQIARGDLHYDPAISQAFAEAYNLWLAPCTKVEAAIQWFEKNHEPIKNADRFRKCVREIRLHSVDVDGMLKSLDDLQKGRGVPLCEALDELRDHCSP